MTKEDLDGAHVGTGFQQMDGECAQRRCGGTDSLSTPSLSGIGPAKILNGAYPCCLPFWVMLTWLILIGIFPFIRS